MWQYPMCQHLTEDSEPLKNTTNQRFSEVVTFKQRNEWNQVVAAMQKSGAGGNVGPVLGAVLGP